MQDWEEQRELFPTRQKAVEKPPSRPRIRPNIFARIARTSAGNPALVLITAMFLVAAAMSFAAFNLTFDFKSPIEISTDDASQKTNNQLTREFPEAAQLIIVRVSAEKAEPAKSAAKSVAAELEKDKANIAHAFIPGIGQYYDRFAIYYIDVAAIEARVQHVTQLNPLFQALAVSPNLSGLSALIGEVATAVQNGRSPQGLEQLFLQISQSVRGQAEGKPKPVDWRAIAGLKIDNATTDWVVIVEPQTGKLTQARLTVERILVNALQAQPALKMTAEYPPDSLSNDAGSMGRQVVVASALAILLFNLLMGFGLQQLRMIVFVIVPVLSATIMGLVAASLVVAHADRMVMTLFLAVLLPVSAAAICMAGALTKSRLKSISGISFIMLAAQETGFLVLTICAIATALWLSWFHVAVESLSSLAVIFTFAVLAGLATICSVLPSLAVMQTQAGPNPSPRSSSDALSIQWRSLRPILAILLVAASLFCVVFFSSLHFSGNAASDVTRGLQFITTDEKAATKLADDLKSVPEVGTVRWMGTFMPDDMPGKQKALQGLAGALVLSGAAGAAGPHDLVANLQNMETGLRVIADAAGTDEGLRNSANELRRSLAVLTNTTTAIEPTAVELENLIFSGFADLPKEANDMAALSAPQASDLPPVFRKLFVSDNGKWRIEVLPKRIITPAAFIAATGKTGSTPLGPLVKAQAELTALQSMLTRPLAMGLGVSLLMALAYLRRVFDWLIVVLATLLPLPLFAGFAVTTDTAIEPLALPALVMAITASLIMALLTVVRKRYPHTSLLAIFMPLGLVLAIILPLQLLQIRELDAFSRALLVFLPCVALINATVVQQLCAWTIGGMGSGPRKPPRRITSKPVEDLSDDVF